MKEVHGWWKRDWGCQGNSTALLVDSFKLGKLNFACFGGRCFMIYFTRYYPGISLQKMYFKDQLGIFIYPVPWKKRMLANLFISLALDLCHIFSFWRLFTEICFDNGVISSPAVPSFLLWHEDPMSGPVNPILVPVIPTEALKSGPYPACLGCLT